MKVATWNVNSIRVRLEQVLAWLDENQPDVLALQETKVSDELFPQDAFAAAGYLSAFAGQKTYNGVAVLSRHPLSEVSAGIPGFDDPERRVLRVTTGGVRVVNLYVVNGQAVDTPKYHHKLGWLKHVERMLANELKAHPNVLVVGDFNIAPDDRDVYDPEGWRGGILCSDAERQALADLLGLGLSDTFRHFTAEAGHYSWWDYRGGAFRRNRGLRIDLVLASASLLAVSRACATDTAPRSLERPSDHAPVMAHFELDPVTAPDTAPLSP